MGLTVEHQLKVSGRRVWLAQPMQLNVAQQQSDKCPPSDDGSLRFSIRRSLIQLIQQI